MSVFIEAQIQKETCRIVPKWAVLWQSQNFSFDFDLVELKVQAAYA